jgi:3-deoxy-D-manno-octulosonic-acid transferase
VTGNLKFAQALCQLETPPLADNRYALPPGAVLLVAGSTHPGEEEELLDCYRRLREKERDVFLMIAPRHPERLEAIRSLINRRGYTTQLWSCFSKWRREHITVVDSVGNLPRLYSLAHFVFVGGSFVNGAAITSSSPRRGASRFSLGLTWRTTAALPRRPCGKARP